MSRPPSRLIHRSAWKGVFSEVHSALACVTFVVTLGRGSSCRVGVVREGTRERGEEAPNGA